MKKIFFISTILLAFLTLNVCSQEPDMEIMVGEIKPIAVDAPTRVSVQDPEIVEIAKVADKEIIIAGKSEGTTTVMIWDKDGAVKFQNTGKKDFSFIFQEWHLRCVPGINPAQFRPAFDTQ